MSSARPFPCTITAMAICAALQPLAARSEIELSVYGGPQWAQPGSIRSATLGDDLVRWDSKPFEIPPYYGLRAAWWPDRERGFGFTFTHAKAFADDPEKYGYQELNFSHGLNFLTADLWHRFQTRGRMTPYVGAGVGIVIPYVEVQPIGQAATAAYQIGGPAVSLMVGASMPLGKSWSVFTEYKATYSRLDAKLETGDRLKTDFLTHAVNIGLSWRF